MTAAALLRAVALAVFVAFAACATGPAPDEGDETAEALVRDHEAAIRRFQLAIGRLEHDAGAPGCAQLCQPAVEACQTARKLCGTKAVGGDAAERRCQVAKRGCDWTFQEMPAHCRSCLQLLTDEGSR